MQFTATRLRVDHDEDEPNVTAGDLEIARNDRGKVSWALTIFTDEPWHHGRGECRLLIEVDLDRVVWTCPVRGEVDHWPDVCALDLGISDCRAARFLIRSDWGRWHYFEGAGNLGHVAVFDDSEGGRRRTFASSPDVDARLGSAGSSTAR